MGPSGGCHVSDNFDVGIGAADLSAEHYGIAGHVSQCTIIL